MVLGLEKRGFLNGGISNEGILEGNQHNWFFIINFRNFLQVHIV